MNLRTLLAAAVLITLPLVAQTKRPMTFADLQAMKRVSDPQISPSGKWVLFSVTEVTLEKNSKVNHLWVVPLAGGKETKITIGSGETNGRFSPDGKWVMYTSTEGGRSEIWIAPWNESEGTIGKGHAVTTLETEADGAIWSPDSKHFLFTSEVYPDCRSTAPTEIARAEEEEDCNTTRDAAEAKNPVHAQVFTELLYRHWGHYQGQKRSHIFYGAIEGHRNTPVDITPASVIGDHVAPTFSLGGPLGYAISPDGKEIAYVVNLDPVPAESTNNDIYVLRVGADPRTAKKVSTSPGSDDGPAYSPDGKYLAWRSQARNGYESDKFRLTVMERASGAVKDRTEGFDLSVDEFIWNNDSKSLYYVAADGGSADIFQTLVARNVTASRSEGRLKLSFALTSAPGFEYFRETTAKVPDSGEYSQINLSSDGTRLIASKMTVEAPAEIVVFDTRQNSDSNVGDNPSINESPELPRGQEYDRTFASHALTAMNKSLLAALDLSPLQPYLFHGANNTQVEGFLIKPPNFDPSKKYPVKFLIHGGPQGAWGDAWSYRWNPELFAADGYVVVMVNPRGSTGYGQKFVEEVSGDWGGRPYIDLMKGLDYAEQHYSFIDKDRECALGASYGGFMADWVLTHTNRFKCIVTHDGMYNPQSAFGTTEELWFNQWEFRPLNGAGSDATVVENHPAHPWDFYDRPANQDPFRKWSPMLSIKNAKTPTLVIHGQRDYRLDVSEGLQLFDSLQMLHVPSKMVYFENEGHWVLKPKDSEFWYQQVNDWTDRWLGMGKYAATGPEKNPLAPTAPPAITKKAVH